MKNYFKVIRRCGVFKPGDIVKVSDEEVIRYKDYVVIKTESGARLQKFNFKTNEESIIGKVVAVIRNL